MVFILILYTKLEIESHWRNCFLCGSFILNNCNRLVAITCTPCIEQVFVGWLTAPAVYLMAYASVLSPSSRTVRHVHHNNYYQHRNRKLVWTFISARILFFYIVSLSKLLFFQTMSVCFFFRNITSSSVDSIVCSNPNNIFEKT